METRGHHVDWEEILCLGHSGWHPLCRRPVCGTGGGPGLNVLQLGGLPVEVYDPSKNEWLLFSEVPHVVVHGHYTILFNRTCLLAPEYIRERILNTGSPFWLA